MQKVVGFVKRLTSSQLISIALGCLLPLCNLTSHTWLPLSPVILFYMLAVVVVLFLFDNMITERPLSIEKATWRDCYIPLLFTLYIFISQFFMGAPFARFFGASIAATYFFLCLILFEQIKEEQLAKYVRYFIYFAVGVLCLEAALRYLANIYGLLVGDNFYFGIYRFKFNGPMYYESNGTAIHILLVLFFVFWWGKIKNEKLLLIKTILFVLLILTLSRAAWLAAVAGLIYYYLLRNRSKKFWLTYGLGTLCVVVLAAVFLLYPKIAYDSSFRSKFYIAEQIFDYFRNASLKQLLFGVGLSESEEIMGIYAHNYFLVYLTETGIFGFLLLIGMFILFLVRTNGEALIVLLPFMVHTSTTTNTFLPYFYVIMAIMYSYRKHRLTANIYDPQARFVFLKKEKNTA